MKICIVTPEYPGKTGASGGIGTYIRHLAEEMILHGYELHVLIVGSAKTKHYLETGVNFHELHIDIPAWIHADILIRHVPAKMIYIIWKVSRELQRLCRIYSFDLVQTTSYQALCLTYLLSRRRRPVVTWVSTIMETATSSHTPHVSHKQKIIFFFEKIAICLSDFIVTHSKSHCDFIAKKFGIDKHRVCVIPLGVELSVGVRPDPANERKDVNVLYVGRLEPRKGTDVLLSAIADVLSSNSQVTFTLVGVDHTQSYEKKFRAQHPKISNKVFFKGFVDEKKLNRFYQECDVFVSPTRYESFGLTFVEAMRFGKPVVGCRVGGVAEIVLHGATGYLVEPDNVSELAYYINKLVRNNSLRQSMGKQAANRAQQHFSRQRMAARAAIYYSSILQGNRLGESAVWLS